MAEKNMNMAEKNAAGYSDSVEVCKLGLALHMRDLSLALLPLRVL